MKDERKGDGFEGKKAFFPTRWSCHMRAHNILRLVNGVHLSEKASPGRAAEFSQGIHPLENRIKKSPLAPTGRQKKSLHNLP